MGDSHGAPVAKNLPAGAGDPGDGSVSEPERSPRVGNGNSTPACSPGKSQGQRSLEGYNPWGSKGSDTTE